ncbi:hypothetical protein [Spirillospora sp. NPDC029432]|uniref:hypothetical protein n=1 Tax=Spirillospora sp. NPDC029432 TaxID=3154599 RepID=UPI0034559B08
MRRLPVLAPRDGVLLLAAAFLSAASLAFLAGGGTDDPSPARPIAAPRPLPDLCRHLPHAVRDAAVPSPRVDHQKLDRNRAECGWRAGSGEPVSLVVKAVRAPAVHEAERDPLLVRAPAAEGVAGLGEEAFVRRDAGGVEVVAREGAVVVSAEHSDADVAAVRGVAAELLRLARG